LLEELLTLVVLLPWLVELEVLLLEELLLLVEVLEPLLVETST
jgi:hypothetical protein